MTWATCVALVATFTTATSSSWTVVSVRGGAKTKAKADGSYTKKTFSAASCVQDHLTVMLNLPKIMDAYVGWNAIPASTNEAIMVGNKLRTRAFGTTSVRAHTPKTPPVG